MIDGPPEENKTGTDNHHVTLWPVLRIDDPITVAQMVVPRREGPLEAATIGLGLHRRRQYGRMRPPASAEAACR